MWPSTGTRESQPPVLCLGSPGCRLEGEKILDTKMSQVADVIRHDSCRHIGCILEESAVELQKGTASHGKRSFRSTTHRRLCHVSIYLYIR